MKVLVACEESQRVTIEYWVTRDDIHKRLTGESEV